MYKTIVSFIIVLLLLTGCSAKGHSADKVNQFYSDSETINDLLYMVYSEQRTKLTDEEQTTFSDYELLYGKDSEFYNDTDDSNIKVISSSFPYMKLLLTSDKDIVTGQDNKAEFLKEYEDVKRYLTDAN